MSPIEENIKRAVHSALWERVIVQSLSGAAAKVCNSPSEEFHAKELAWAAIVLADAVVDALCEEEE